MVSASLPRAKKAFEGIKRIDDGNWAWGQRALTRISELRALADLMALRAGSGNQTVAMLARNTHGIWTRPRKSSRRAAPAGPGGPTAGSTGS
jgi:hypothetical protein